MATVGYISVSTDKLNDERQKLNILNFVNDHLKVGVDEWIEVKASTRKSAEKRKGRFRDIRLKGVNPPTLPGFMGRVGQR
jgi:DNA invertase Pin-like site-specific DNA recombinase